MQRAGGKVFNGFAGEIVADNIRDAVGRDDLDRAPGNLIFREGGVQDRQDAAELILREAVKEPGRDFGTEIFRVITMIRHKKHILSLSSAEGCDIINIWRVCLLHIFRQSVSGDQPRALFLYAIYK